MRNLLCLRPAWIYPPFVLALVTASSATASPLLLSTPVYNQGHFTFSIKGESKAGYVILSSTNLSDWTTIATNSSYASTRTAEVPAPGEQTFFKIQEVPESRFRFGLATKGSIQLAGNVLIDSYDSSDPFFSTNGLYDPTKRKDNGDVGCEGQLIDATNANLTIYGSISTGPEGVVGLSDSATIGDSPWVDAGDAGIEPGKFRDYMNVNFPDVAAPFTGGGFSLASGIVGGTNYTYVLLNSKYQATRLSLSGGMKLIVVGSAVLYVTGDLTLSGASFFFITPGSRLSLYVGGTNAVFGGQGINNASGFATNFVYYGLTNNTSVTVSGSNAFTGIIYAPRAALNVPVGGTIYGATVSSTFSAGLGLNLHYDESLASASWLR